MSEKLSVLDGNAVVARAAYEFTEIAAIYPITPSSPMATSTDQWSASGRKNMFGQPVRLVEMQSEAGAAGAVHGALQTGSLATTFTSSQGLMLMIPVLYRIAGEQLPAVIHVAARTVGTHAMSIFGDHSDVMACRQTGFAQICSSSVQEAADLAACAHLAAVKAKVPFMHFFDGFRTSHEISSVELPDLQAMSALMDTDALQAFRAHALNPEHPRLRNTVQNGDVYFQMREAANRFYDAVPDIVEDYLTKLSAICGRSYHLFEYYGDPEAEDVIVAMGSVSGTICETVDRLNAMGHKTGFVQVRLYRPFAVDRFLQTLPASTRRVAVLDRCKEMGSAGEPLYLDVCAALTNSGRDVFVLGGRYGLSSKDTDPAQIAAVYRNLRADAPINRFTIGICDDVTGLSLPVEPFDVTDPDTFCCKFWGLGGDGTVGANHNTAKILGDCAGLYSQAYFEYDAKKSFGTTKSHLRFSKKPIRGSYYVRSADFVACHNQSFLASYDIAEELRPGGSFLINCTWTPEELAAHLPGKTRRFLAQNDIRLYIINATAIAERLGLGSHTNTVLQAAFFRLANLMDPAQALEEMKAAARRSYATKGDDVIERNLQAIDAGADGVVSVPVPADWADAPDDIEDTHPEWPDAVRNILIPINRQKGDDLPVSAFSGREDGSMEPGLTAFEKRGIAVNIPQWNASACLQCNLCSFVCPHASVRPYLLDESEAAAAPDGFDTIEAKGAKGYRYSLQISAYDCTGCGSCASVCPAPGKALTMVPAALDEAKKQRWSYAVSLRDKGDVFSAWTVKGSQFRQPLVEFSAACAGCGETPYAKLMTQLFGDRVYWANGTGCSQAWGAPMPGIPYTVNAKGRGPAWTNSLFENNAELALGMYLSVAQQRDAEKLRVERLADETENAAVRGACRDWLAAFDDFDASRAASDRLIDILTANPVPGSEDILRHADQLAKKTFWMYGGDGWAYDIGFGGLDHVIASGENINVLVIDTEVYSNTGGQSSKATPIGAVAQFAASGKKVRKKDLGAIMMSYGNVYVAQVAMGADPAQLVRALKEAEEYPGPSVIVAYTPCQAHGIRAGMSNVQAEMKRAVKSGYWLLYRYDPRREKPLTLDSRQPDMDYEQFLDGETRFASLRQTFPANAEKLFRQGAEDAAARYQHYSEMSK